MFFAVNFEDIAKLAFAHYPELNGIEKICELRFAHDFGEGEDTMDAEMRRRVGFALPRKASRSSDIGYSQRCVRELGAVHLANAKIFRVRELEPGL